MADTVEQKQPKVSNWASKKMSYTRKVIKEEIATLKDKVREAYAIGAKIEDGYEATKEEKEIIEEQGINTKLIEKLEKLYITQKEPSTFSISTNTKREGGHKNISQSSSSTTHHQKDKDRLRNTEGYVDFIRPETMTLLHFFYLVRLAQQGFFHLISSVYPTLEPQAITYLADKLIGTSIYADRLKPRDRFPHKKAVSILIHNLMEAKDEPVAEGFKTTFKQIMEIIHQMMNQTLLEQQKQTSHVHVDAAPTVATTVPPIWVVMPYSSMMDNQTFAMPGAIPTLPYPSTMLPNSFIPPSAIPFIPLRPNPAEELHRSTANQEVAKDEQVQDEPQEEQEEQKEPYNKYDDDRFADPEWSDDEEEDEEEEEEEEQEEEEEGEEEEHAEEKPAVPIVAKNDDRFEDTSPPESIIPPTINTDFSPPPPTSAPAQLPKANSSWSTFVNASPARTESNSSSPRSSTKSPSGHNRKF